jgi:hypothetical protein
MLHIGAKLASLLSGSSADWKSYACSCIVPKVLLVVSVCVSALLGRVIWLYYWHQSLLYVSAWILQTLIPLSHIHRSNGTYQYLCLAAWALRLHYLHCPLRKYALVFPIVVSSWQWSSGRRSWSEPPRSWVRADRLLDGAPSGLQTPIQVQHVKYKMLEIIW